MTTPNQHHRLWHYQCDCCGALADYLIHRYGLHFCAACLEEFKSGIVWTRHGKALTTGTSRG